MGSGHGNSRGARQGIQVDIHKWGLWIPGLLAIIQAYPVDIKRDKQ